MSLFKLALLVCSALSFHLGLGKASSPNEEDKVMPATNLRERIWRRVGLPSGFLLKAFVWQTTIGESVVILSSTLDMPRPSGSILNVFGPAESSILTVTFVLGAFLVIIGGILRILSFRALGPSYTFIQCIRKEHKLITTGPYAVVRHPGYAGLLYCLVGGCLVYGIPESWLRTSGVLDYTWNRVLLGCVSLITLASFPTVFRRSTDEDHYLSKKFGAEWETWARRVKYRLVPYVW